MTLDLSQIAAAASLVLQARSRSRPLQLQRLSATMQAVLPLPQRLLVMQQAAALASLEACHPALLLPPLRLAVC